ncbi:Ribonuclease HII [invertebrate metagenome]|uniref:Ribonuclease HII n=1 Tax=invertebrate metagenome TaxID=1711999 RepID=A0A484H4V8_9ZZZZ
MKTADEHRLQSHLQNGSKDLKVFYGEPVPDINIERRLGGRVAGLDEVGRGALAGPVVAAAVVLHLGRLPAQLLATLDDSKRLSLAQRESLFAALTDTDYADIGTGQADVAEIDALNILKATFLAMTRAIGTLRGVDYAIVDGNQAPALRCPAFPLVKGDRLSVSIAAASIVAKVTRDRLMMRLAEGHPGYRWERNVGYGTPAHRAAIAKLGLTPHHRRSFRLGVAPQHTGSLN